MLPEPIGLQPQWFGSPASRKVLRVGRRGTKTRFALGAALVGHGPGWEQNSPMYGGVLAGGDVVWIAQTYTNLTTVLWREEIEPRMGHLPWARLNKSLHDIDIPGVGSLLLRSGEREAIRSVRGVGKTLRGVIVDEAAWLDLRSALQDIILPACLDNNAWLVLMSTTNAGSDGGYDDAGKPQIPSYFNVVCHEIASGKRSSEWVEFCGTAYDNPTLSAAAIDELVAEYTPGSPRLAQEVYAQLLATGIGLALPGLSAATHMVAAFSPPTHWPRFAGFDWGYHHPWALGLYVSDEDGQVVKRDTLTGRLDLPQNIDAAVRAGGVDLRRLPIYAGPDVWRTRVSSKGQIKGQFLGPTVAEELQRLGWHLVPAADARVAGLNNLRLYTHIPPEHPEARPRLVWMDTPGNRANLATTAAMTLDPKNPEDTLKMDADAAGRGGDDHYDETRYALMSRPIVASAVTPGAGENESLGYDYAKQEPRRRETGEEAMQRLLGGTGYDARANRYAVPPGGRRGR